MSDYIPSTFPDHVIDFFARFVQFDFREVYFGLGLFFLISGYVIPLSMGKGSQVEYLLRRIFRIYPVVVACTLIAFFAVAMDRWVSGASSYLPIDGPTLWANILLIRDFKQYQFMDPSLWTLEVEMHFYVICFFIGFRGAYKSATVLLSIAGAFCLMSFYSAAPALANTFPGVVVDVLGNNGAFITLMLVGTALFNRSFNGWSLRKTALVIAALLFANKFCLSTHRFYAGDTGLYMYSNHIVAILFFMALLLAGPRLPYVRWLDRLANVSYPLYLLHGAAAYAVFFTAFRLTGSTVVAGIVAAVSVVIATWFVHVYVENVGIAIGKKLRRQIPTPQPPTP